MDIESVEARLEALVEDDSLPEMYKQVTEHFLLEQIDRLSPLDIAQILISVDEANLMPPPVLRLVMDVLTDAAEDDGDALCSLGALYYTGRAGEQDYKKALHYYTLADEAGSLQATENLGYCYYYGRSVPVDYEKAYRYFAKGALLGMTNSLYKLGDMYRYGYYVDKDEREAFRLYRRCCRKMSRVEKEIIGGDVYHRMGDVYALGIGAEANLLQALRFYQKAERYYVVKIRRGDFLVRKRLREAIARQEAIRQKIMETLPSFDWVDGE